MTNHSKVYDMELNLNHSKSQSFYLSQFSFDLYQTLDSTFKDLIPPLQISTNSNAYISVNSQPILVKFWILNLMTNPNKVYDTKLNLNHSKSQPLLSQFSFDLYQTLDSTFKDQS